MTRKSCCVDTPASERYTVTVTFTWTRTREHHRGVCLACLHELEATPGAALVTARPFIQEWMTVDRHEVPA